MSDARAALLDTTIAHVATHGLSDLSLREIAGAVGSSHRMLHYHFGGRDGLVAAIVDSIETQQRAALEALASGVDTPRQLIERQWDQLTDPEVRPFVALFFEVLALALHRRPGTDGFLDTLTDPWLDLAERIAGDLHADLDRDELRLGVAVVRGLSIEVVATGDPEPATRSLRRFLDRWDHATG
ncbi:MAG: TetR/AcrR family transcriptional regulator [Acidimicrobiales bacterium]